MVMRAVLWVSAFAAIVAAATAWAAEDPLQKPLHEACLANDAGWIGKSQKEIDTNCTCKAKTEAGLASADFREAILKKSVYDSGVFPFGDTNAYMKKVLTDCPQLRQRMVDAMCHDPAAPPDACAAVKDMVSKLK